MLAQPPPIVRCSKGFATMSTQKWAFTGLLLQITHIALALLLVIDIVNCEYENTWNFYYEQPCCSSQNGHHLRHHKGKHPPHPTHTTHKNVLKYFMI